MRSPRIVVHAHTSAEARVRVASLHRQWAPPSVLVQFSTCGAAAAALRAGLRPNLILAEESLSVHGISDLARLNADLREVVYLVRDCGEVVGISERSPHRDQLRSEDYSDRVRDLFDRHLTP